jgi:hypothetical protein
MIETTWKVMLGPLLRMVKELKASIGCAQIAGKHVAAADEAVQQFVRQPLCYSGFGQQWDLDIPYVSIRHRLCLEEK